MADKKTTKVTEEVTEEKETPKEPESNDIDDRMERLLKDHVAMGARPDPANEPGG